MRYLSPAEGRTSRGNLRYLEDLRELAKNNRRTMTMAEALMWNMILRKNKMGYLFLNQKPIGRFILDFYCSKLLLAIEIDGGSHDNKENYDKGREGILSQRNIKTIRYTNEQVLRHLVEVKVDLGKKIKEREEEII